MEEVAFELRLVESPGICQEERDKKFQAGRTVLTTAYWPGDGWR